jgi:hypothetical protein
MFPEPFFITKTLEQGDNIPFKAFYVGEIASG